MNANERGLGEIIDELVTLSFKITHRVDVDRSCDRSNLLLDYIDKTELSLDAKLVLTLMMTNAACWVCQDEVTSGGNAERVAALAVEAQRANKLRNLIMGEFNKNEGIVTKKSY